MCLSRTSTSPSGVLLIEHWFLFSARVEGKCGNFTVLESSISCRALEVAVSLNCILRSYQEMVKSIYQMDEGMFDHIHVYVYEGTCVDSK